MIVQCPSCQTKFSVDSVRVQSSANPRFHCSRCDHLFHLKRSANRGGATSDPRQLPLLNTLSPSTPPTSPPLAAKTSWDQISPHQNSPRKSPLIDGTTEEGCETVAEREEWDEELDERDAEEVGRSEFEPEEDELEVDEEEWEGEDGEFSLDTPEFEKEERVTVHWPVSDPSQPYEADIGRGTRSALTVRQSGSFIPEKGSVEELSAGELPHRADLVAQPDGAETVGGEEVGDNQERFHHPQTAGLSSPHGTPLSGNLPKQKGTTPPDSLKGNDEARAHLEARVLQTPRTFPHNLLFKPLRSDGEAPANGSTRLDQPLHHRVSHLQPPEGSRSVVNFPDPSPPSEFKRRRQSLLPGAIVFGALVGLPSLLLLGFWVLISSPQLTRLADFGSASLPRVPPREIELVDITAERLTLSDGSKVVEITGRAINDSGRSFKDLEIEAKLYDTQNQVVQSVKAPLNNKLFESRSIQTLSVRDLKDLQSSGVIKVRELRPQSGAPFRIILEEHGEARWFGARVRSVHKL